MWKLADGKVHKESKVVKVLYAFVEKISLILNIWLKFKHQRCSVVQKVILNE